MPNYVPGYINKQGGKIRPANRAADRCTCYNCIKAQSMDAGMVTRFDGFDALYRDSARPIPEAPRAEKPTPAPGAEVGASHGNEASAASARSPAPRNG